MINDVERVPSFKRRINLNKCYTKEIMYSVSMNETQ